MVIKRFDEGVRLAERTAGRGAANGRSATARIAAAVSNGREALCRGLPKTEASPRQS